MNTMRAARLLEAGRPLILDEIPIPTPGPGEVLVRVEACGVCGTDVHLAVAGDLPVARSPITLGHEAAGVVAAIGAGVTTPGTGDRVALFPAAWCGECRWCQTGRHSLCARSEVYGMSRDGSLAEYVVAPARAVVPIPDSVPSDIAAIITDGVATPFHALRSRGNLRPGERVGVVGCGGLGTHAIMLARLLGADRVVAVDPDPAARERAIERGADLALDPTDPETTRALRSDGGLDLTLEFVGRASSAELAVKALSTGGRAVFVGVGPDRPTLPPLAAFVGREQSVLGSFGMDQQDILDLLDLAATGRLDLTGSISARYPLDRANEALARLVDRSGPGVVRVVVQP